MTKFPRPRLWTALLLVGWGLVIADPGAAAFERIETEAGAWWLVIPSAASGQTVPTVVFLHGTGGSATSWRNYLDEFSRDLGLAFAVPEAGSIYGFGIADDTRLLEAVVGDLGARGFFDPTRLYLAGHSSGGAFAYLAALQTRVPVAAVLVIGAPFRPVLVRDPHQPDVPFHLQYGEDDPNFFGGAFGALADQLDRLALAWTAEVIPGAGHNDWPDAVFEASLAVILGSRAPACRSSFDRVCLAGRVGVSWPPGEGVEVLGGAGDTIYLGRGAGRVSMRLRSRCPGSRFERLEIESEGLELELSIEAAGSSRAVGLGPGPTRASEIWACPDLAPGFEP